MRGQTRVRKALVVAGLVACGSSGCLQPGGPPIGEHWLSGRTLWLVEFAPDLPGVPPSLLVANVRSDTEMDLYVIADPGPSAPSSAAPPVVGGAKLLVSNVATAALFSTSRTLPEDALGRLLLAQAPAPAADYSYASDLFRIDLTTETAMDLGPQSSFVLSPSGGRLVLVGASGNNATVYEADGRQTALTNIRALTFVGEDLCGLENDNPADFTMASLQEVSPDGAPQTIAEPVSGFTVVPTPNGPFVVISMQDDLNYSQSLFDLTTLAETPLPGDYQSVSPDGRWLLLRSESNEGEFFDRSTGAVQDIDTPYLNGFWRPGQNEYWTGPTIGYSAESSGGPASPIQIWQPGTGTTTVDVAAEPTAYPRTNDGSDSPFTADGQHWFSSIAGNGNHGQVFVGPTDDLGAPTFPVNPLGTSPGGYWQLADGRLLVEASVSTFDSDIYLLDPNSGQELELATGGYIVTIGLTRALALLNVISAGTGDLTLIDYATGATTLLGQNVTSAVLRHPFDPSNPTVDALASGAEVAFLVRDELDSPYDGVWVATLP